MGLALFKKTAVVMTALLCIAWILLPSKKKQEWQCIADPFHQLIEPYPPCDSMCTGEVLDDLVPDRATYRLELQIVTVPYGRSPCVIPPTSGYVTNRFQFNQQAQGDVRCNIIDCPRCTVSNGKAASINSGSWTVLVKKSNNHFHLEYTLASGNTYLQDFELPEGVTFATNLGEHPVVNCCISTGPNIFPFDLSIFNPLFIRHETFQMEEFLLLKIVEAETTK